MQIDGRGLARAAEQLEVALRHVDAAQQADVPLLLGRSPAREAVQRQLGDARDWATSAAVELRRAVTPAADDARRAVEQLASDIDGMRFAKDVLSARRGASFQATVDGARAASIELGSLRDGAAALKEGSALAWLLRMTAPGVAAGELRAVRALAKDVGAESLGAATSGFLQRTDDADPRSVELARMSLEHGGSTASSALLDDLMSTARRGAKVDQELLRTALIGLDDGVGDGARRLPGWLPPDAAGAHPLDDIQVRELELMRSLEPPEALAAKAGDLLERPPGSLSRDELVELAAITQLPEHAAPRIAHSSIDGVSLADRVRSGEVADPQLQRMWAGSLEEAAVPGRAEELLAAPATADVAHRTAAIAEVHADALFGPAGSATWREELRAGLAATRDDDEARLLLDTVALHRAAPDPAGLENEARALLTAQQLDANALRRLAVLAGQRDGVRPPLLDDFGDELSRAARSGESTTTIDDARWPLERDAIVADPAGRLTALERVENVLARPFNQLTTADLRRVQRFSTLPEPVRPDLSQGPLPYSLDEVVDSDWLPGGFEARELLQDLRFRVARQRLELDPATTRDRLVRELDTMLSKTDEQVTETDLRRLALIDAMPPTLRPELPPTATSYSRRRIFEDRWLPASDADAKAEFTSLRRWNDVRRVMDDPAVTREHLVAEIDAIIAKPDDAITVDDLQRLAFLDELPGAKRPELPSAATAYGRRQIADSRWLPSHDHDARRELASLRLWRDHARAASDTTVTRAGTTAELDAILAKADDQITRDDMRRIAVIGELPAERRPAMPRVEGMSRSDMYLAGLLPASDDKARVDIGSLRWWNETRAMLEDASVTRASLADELDAILAKSDEEITAADLRRVAVLDMVQGEKSLGFPPAATQYSRRRIAAEGWRPDRDVDARAEFTLLRKWRATARVMEDPAITRESLTAELDRMLAKPDEEITIGDLHRLAAIDGLPAAKRPELPPTATQYSRASIAEHAWLPPADSDARSEFAHLRNWSEMRRMTDDPAVTRATLETDLDRILAKADEDVTIDDVRRLSMFEMAPADKRPALPRPATDYSRQKLVTRGWLPGSDSDARAEFENLRVFREAQRLAEDPAMTPERVLDDLRAILAKPNESVDVDDLRQLRLIDNLPAGIRPDLPPPGAYSRARIHASRWLPSSDADARTEFDSLRAWLDRRDFLADPANTTDRLRDRIVRIALKQDDDVTVDDLRTLAMVDGLPADRRPPLPPPATQYSRERIWAGRWLPSRDSDARAEFSSLRSWAIMQTPEGRAEAAEWIRNGETLDPRTIAALAASGEEALAEAGIALDELLRTARGTIIPTEDGARNLDQIREGLALTRQLLDAGSSQTPPELRPVAEEAVRLLQRNIDRIDGTLGGGYSNYPDYAELGRAATNVDLLLAARTTPTPSPPATTAASSARTGADTLSW